jgi:hypothetical protein
MMLQAGTERNLPRRPLDRPDIGDELRRLDGGKEATEYKICW